MWQFSMKNSSCLVFLTFTQTTRSRHIQPLDRSRFCTLGLGPIPKVWPMHKVFCCSSSTSNWNRMETHQDKESDDLISSTALVPVHPSYLACLNNVYDNKKGSCHQNFFWFTSCKICSWRLCAWSQDWNFMFLASKSIFSSKHSQ